MKRFILALIASIVCIIVGLIVADQVKQHTKKPRYRSTILGRRWVDTSRSS